MQFTEQEKLNWLAMWGFAPDTPEADRAWSEKLDMHSHSARAHFVKDDVKAYRSMVTGEMIEGRKAHREHLKRNNVVEVGNDLDNYKPPPQKPDMRLKETIARQVYEKLRY